MKILDVGCGNKSPQNTKKFFPLSKYYGIDRYDVFKGIDYKSINIEKFWNIDLEKSDLSELPNDFFDVIIMSHVIEHLKNGNEILSKLSQKLKQKGLFYIEFPSYHTSLLPSMKKKGITFNFYDDKTHLKLYRKNEIIKSLRKNNFKILRAKIYCNWKKILLFPLFLIIRYIKDKEEYLYELWWLVGWCTYILSIKNEQQDKNE